ncbi:hypothetical protein OC845_006077 [Tilletia horrida]|nr:hypothetical protein OC845_006077 [Tilletia horrida]
MLGLTLGISSVFALLLSFGALYPYIQYTRYHFPATKPSQLAQPPLNPHYCEQIPELAHCDDIAVHKPSGHAYFTCDDTRLWKDPLRLRTDDAPASRKGGSIWHLDLNDPASVPHPLDLGGLPAGGFHPAGITLTTVNFTQHNHSDPSGIMLLVSSYPEYASATGSAPHPGVVDVLVHDLGSASSKLRHHRRLGPSHFHANWRGSTPLKGRERVEEADAGTQLSPWRLSVFLEQESAPLPPDVAGSGPDLSIPSFFFSSAPVLSETANLTALRRPIHTDGDAEDEQDFFPHLAKPNPLAYLTDAFLPGSASRAHVNLIKPPAHIYVYVAQAATSMPSSDGTMAVSSGLLGGGSASSSSAGALPGYPPIPRAWDGGGEAAGRNNSASSVFVLGTTASRSGVHEYEQHWVRPIPSLLRLFIELPAYTAAKRKHYGGEKAVSIWNDKAVIFAYTPQFVTFMSQQFNNVQSAIGNDVLGRFWTAGSLGGSDAARKWLNHLRKKSSSDSASASSSKELTPPAPRRPPTTVNQITHLYRHGPSVAHPWETERLRAPREAGMFLPKEFYSTPIYRSAPAPLPEEDDVGQFRALTLQPVEGGKRVKTMGFLPTLPTGLEVDHERGWVLVSSVWDERGAARCEIPKHWAEP